jgi:photosystem II oxygen-evolving enhancer protein 1
MASLQAAATLMQPTKFGSASRAPSVQSVSMRSTGRVSCSLQSDVRELAQKCGDAAKLAGFALATSALVVSVQNSIY